MHISFVYDVSLSWSRDSESIEVELEVKKETAEKPDISV